MLTSIPNLLEDFRINAEGMSSSGTTLDPSLIIELGICFPF